MAGIFPEFGVVHLCLKLNNGYLEYYVKVRHHFVIDVRYHYF